MKNLEWLVQTPVFTADEAAETGRCRRLVLDNLWVLRTLPAVPLFIGFPELNIYHPPQRKLCLEGWRDSNGHATLHGVITGQDEHFQTL